MAYAIRLNEGERVRLREIDPRQDGGLKREEGEARLAALSKELDELQELLYAAGSAALLIVLQGLDTSGKDGTIRNVLRDVDPQGVRVVGFKVPTAIELAHDFLWRIHRQTPELGMMVVFNRSQYEDVIVVRVKQLAPESIWQERYGHINDFEQLLTESGTLVAKFYLHISKDEQEKRLRDSERDVEKAWKLSARRLDRAAQLGRVHRRLRGRPLALFHCLCPVVRRPRRPQVVSHLAVIETLVNLLRPHREQWLSQLRRRGEAALAEIHAAQGIDRGV